MTQTAVDTKQQVIESLQQQLSNAFVLYANYKKYHWQSYGPLFRDLHLLFEDHATAVLGTTDELAERIRIFGGLPVADPRQFVSRGTVQAASENQSMREMIEEARKNELRVIQELRQAVETADHAGDPGTADLFTRIVQIHEKHEWFLREVTEQKDGLVG